MLVTSTESGRSRDRAAWVGRQVLKVAVCGAGAVGIVACAAVLVATGHEHLGAPLYAYPAAAAFLALGEITDRLSEPAFFFAGMGAVLAFWTVVGLAVWHVTAVLLRLVLARLER